MSQLQHHPAPASAPSRLTLLEWLLPCCEPDRAALLYPKRRGDLSPGWVLNQADAERALTAYRAGTLDEETFTSTTQKGKQYRIHSAQRLGLVPHRDGCVEIFCIDLDDHSGDGGTIHLQATLDRFLGAEAILFTSKGGKGLHAFYRLTEPMKAEAFVAWAKMWGFNRPGQPEVFPKSVRNSQVWLPNEPNECGGDTYRRGSFASCIVRSLPRAPSIALTTTTLTFLRGGVSQPGRNEALNKAAWDLGGRRMGRDESQRLCLQAARLCGLEAEEPEQTLSTFASGYEAGLAAAPGRSGAGGHSAGSPSARLLDGIGNGERFVDRHGAEVRYCYELGAWLVWSGTHWSPEARAEVESRAKATAREILQEMERVLAGLRAEGRSEKELEDIEEAYRRHCRSAARVQGVRDMLTMAQSEPGVRVSIAEMDADPMLLNVRNGTIDLKTGMLHPHRREDLLTRVALVDFDPEAKCDGWMGFLAHIFNWDDDLLEFIQRAVGYSLTGHVGEQCLFFLHGSGANGKSVFIQTLLSVLGPYAQKAPTEMIMKQERASGGAASPDMARLRGVRLAVTAELEEHQRLGEARIKDLTGSDRIIARHLYHEPIEFDPTHKLWIYGNHKPTIRGTDEGIWRRIRLIPFSVTIPEADRNPHLIEQLRAEAAGILAWAVQGCLQWRQQGLGVPDIVTAATEAYRAESDHLGAFLEECCTIADHATVGKGDLYDAYDAWCQSSGEHAASKNRLGRQLAERGFREDRDRHRRCWLGIGLLDLRQGSDTA